jgi:muramoyltetrapeptide carboxypeptidase
MISPKYLKKNDKVAIICMAGKTTLESIRSAIKILEEWGLEVIVGESVGAEDGVFGGNDALRKNDFQQYLDDVNISAIFSARGGYGSTRFLDKINWEIFRQNPKWVCGFSDITAVISTINGLGVEAIHGSMPKLFDIKGGKKALYLLKKALFGEKLKYKYPGNFANKTGRIKAEIVGGNLCILAHCIGSKSELESDGKILFLEDVSEYYYNIDRMLLQLKRAGKLDNLAGLIIGHFTDCKDNDNPFGQTVQEIVAHHTQEYNYPVAYGFPVGHEPDNWPIICGRKTELVVGKEELHLSFDK